MVDDDIVTSIDSDMETKLRASAYYYVYCIGANNAAGNNADKESIKNMSKKQHHTSPIQYNFASNELVSAPDG